jgi:hypothetical protein
VQQSWLEQDDFGGTKRYDWRDSLVLPMLSPWRYLRRTRGPQGAQSAVTDWKAGLTRDASILAPKIANESPHRKGPGER